MKIALVLSPFGEAAPAGLGRSVFEFARAFVAASPEHSFVLLSKGGTAGTLLAPARSFEEIIVRGPIPLSLALAMRRDIDVVISFTPLAPFFCGRAQLVTFAHDFAFLSYGSRLLRPFRQALTALLFAKSARICAVSACTKEEVITHFNVSPEKVVVIYNGYTPPEPDTAIEPHTPYFLAVGVLKERKNTLRIVQAYEEFSRTNEGRMLRIAGACDTPYGKIVRTYVEEKGLAEKVRFEGFVPDSTLSKLYRGAEALVYPSLLEGFGLPLLEAMSRGIPVVTSNRGVLAEVAGEAAILVDPESISSIASGMVQVLEASIRADLITKGRARVLGFSWERSALELKGIALNLTW